MLVTTVPSPVRGRVDGGVVRVRVYTPRRERRWFTGPARAITVCCLCVGRWSGTVEAVSRESRRRRQVRGLIDFRHPLCRLVRRRRRRPYSAARAGHIAPKQNASRPTNRECIDSAKNTPRRRRRRRRIFLADKIPSRPTHRRQRNRCDYDGPDRRRSGYDLNVLYSYGSLKSTNIGLGKKPIQRFSVTRRYDRLGNLIDTPISPVRLTIRNSPIASRFRTYRTAFVPRVGINRLGRHHAHCTFPKTDVYADNHAIISFHRYVLTDK